MQRDLAELIAELDALVPADGALIRIAIDDVLWPAVAWYEGRAWAHRATAVPWWIMFRPDALFREQFFAAEGQDHGRLAVTLLLITLFVTVVAVVLLLMRGAPAA